MAGSVRARDRAWSARTASCTAPSLRGQRQGEGVRDLYGLLTRRVKAGAPVASADPEADAGYALLGTRAAEVIRRTQAFHREVLAIFAGVGAADRARALDEAVDRYLSRPEVSLPDVPKDMTILYDHPYTSFVTDEAGTPRGSSRIRI